MIFIVFLAVTLVRGLAQNGEYDWFKKTYGPSKHSPYAEEWLVRDFFNDQRGGFFVDVGANHYERDSNTFYLEQTLGWSGVAVDAQHEFAENYRKYRPHTKFFVFFVGDHSDGVESFFVPSNRLVASSSKAFADRYDTPGVGHIDFLTMDIELAEPKALAGFDIAKYGPRLVCIELHPEVRQEIPDYVADRHYRIVGRYLRADPENLWFAPGDSTIPKGVQIADAH